MTDSPLSTHRRVADGLAVLSKDPGVRQAIAVAAQSARCHVARDAADLMTGISTIRARVVVVDGESTAAE